MNTYGVKSAKFITTGVALLTPTGLIDVRAAVVVLSRRKAVAQVRFEFSKVNWSMYKGLHIFVFIFTLIAGTSFAFSDPKTASTGTLVVAIFMTTYVNLQFWGGVLIDYFHYKSIENK